MFKRIRPSVFLLAFLLAGCSGYSLVEDKPVTIGSMTVSPQMQWNQAPSPLQRVTLWTADGTALDALYLFSKVEDGQPMLEGAGLDKKNMRPYRKTMLPDEVMELTAYSWNQYAGQQVKGANLKPVAFGSQPGFRFDMDYVTPKGLKMKAMALAAQPGGKLSMILFTAPQEYYFDRYAPTVEKIFASATVME